MMIEIKYRTMIYCFNKYFALFRHYMSGSPKHALILFDIDGYTSIIQTWKLIAPELQQIREGQQCVFRHNKKDYIVEVLQLSDSKQELNTFEKAWSKTERAVALDKKKSGSCGKENGFLLVGMQEDFEQPIPTASRPTKSRPPKSRHTVERRQSQLKTTAKKRQSQLKTATRIVLPSSTVSRPLTKTAGRPPLSKQTVQRQQRQAETATEIVGSNNRKISVLYQGSGQEAPVTAYPKRQPVHLDDLNDDERDCIEARLVNFECGKRTCGTQTDNVIVFKDKDELLSAYDPKGKSLADIYCMIQRQSEQMMEICNFVKESRDKGILEEILNTVKAVKEDREVSRIVQYGLDLDSTANIGQVCLVEPCETVKLVESEVIKEGLQEGNKTDVVTYEDGAETVLERSSCCTAGSVSDANIHFTGHEVISSEDKENQPQVFHPPPSNVPFLTSPPSVQTISQHLNCSSGTIIEISGPHDMLYADENSEVRVAPYLQRQFQSSFAWPGSYAWQIAQKIYTWEELIGHNYFGKLGKQCLSPRRRHAIEHAILDGIGDDVKFVRQAVEGINTGIRNKTNKLKHKGNKTATAVRLQF